LTAEEIQTLRTRAREDCRPLLIELKALEGDQRIERLMKEPLLDRLYWHRHLSKGLMSKADQKRLSEGETDEALVDAQVALAKIRIAVQRAAQRHYGYRGFAVGAEEEILTEMIEKSDGAPVAILFAAYDRALFEYR
jgi:hypothetical protein